MIDRKDIPRVQNMLGRTGRAVANQFEIYTDKYKVFQSYSSIIAMIPYDGSPTVLDKQDWDYSPTTGRYRNKFLREGKAETTRKIELGIYELADLN